MRHGWRSLRRLLAVGVHVLRGLRTIAGRPADLSAPARAEQVRAWAIELLRLLGVELAAEGRAVAGPCLVVANHVSWLDIMVIHAVCPQARFVSKADVKRWPLVGGLTAGAGTLFIERERKRDAMRVVHHVAEALRAGDVVAVFPEGTTADGHALLPFHANLLQAAVVTETPVQPVALRYSEPGHAVSPSVAFVGETSLLQSLWWIACADGLSVRARLLPPVSARGTDRRALAQSLRRSIADALA